MKSKPINYKYACFTCCKAFSREGRWVELNNYRYRDKHGEIRHDGTQFFLEITATCPQCSGPMYLMGKLFKTPRRTDKKAWAEWELLAKKRYMASLRQAAELGEKIDPYFNKHKK